MMTLGLSLVPIRGEKKEGAGQVAVPLVVFEKLLVQRLEGMVAREEARRFQSRMEAVDRMVAANTRPTGSTHSATSSCATPDG